MKRVEVSTEGLLPKIIIKDLCENDIICPDCKGTGLRIENFSFGNDEGKKLHPGKYFPWNNESVSFCQKCFFGVVHLCEYCKQIRKHRYSTHCDCDGYVTKKSLERDEKEQRRFDNAAKITLKQAVDAGIRMLYDEKSEKFFDMDDDFEDDDGNEIKWFYATEIDYIKINIQNAIESACEDLFEDVEDRLEDVEELEKFVDAWCLKNKGNTTTYTPDYKIIVLVEEDNKDA